MKAYWILDGRYDNMICMARNSREARKEAWKSISDASLSWVNSYVDFRVLRAPDFDIYAHDVKWYETVPYKS